MSKKSSQRKKAARRTKPRRELPYIPNLESWTCEEALRRYVYVLLPQYFSSNATDGALFYAFIDGVEVIVRPEMLQQFFADHADQTFITYDASTFHRICTDTFSDSREGHVAVWQLSSDYRLWDVALLALRIEYAEKGFASKINGLEGWTALREKYAVDQVNPWNCLQAVFVGSVHYAVSELPIFRTYWGLDDTDEEGQSWYGVGLPQPINSDECFNILYNKRYDKNNPWYWHRDCPEPRPVECPPEYTRTALSFRRRDLLLCSQTGPLGIGIDLQSAIVADCLNGNQKRCDVRWREETVSQLEREYQETSERLYRSPLKSGFQWDELQRSIKRDERGYLVIERHKLQSRLMEIWKSWPSYVSADFTPPLQGKSKLSLKPQAWFDHRHMNGSLNDWLHLEANAEVLRLQQKCRLPAHVSFPELRCSLSGGFSLLPETEYLQTAPDRRLVSLRINNIDIVVFLCTFASQFLLQALPPGDSPDSSGQTEFIAVAESIRSDLADTSRKPKEIDGPAYADLLKEFDHLSSVRKLELFTEIVRSFVRMEHTDFLRRRLDSKLDLQLNEAQCDVIHWLVLRYLFSPLSPRVESPFFRIPRSGVKGAGLVNFFGFYENPLKKLDPNQLIPQMLKEQIETKSELLWEHIDRDKKVRDFAWTLLNRLSSEDFSALLPFDSPDSECEDIRTAVEMMGKEQVLEDLLMTNAVGISGRIGVPVKFYERLYADCRQVKNDLMTSVAFHLVKEGVDLVMIDESGFCILSPNADEGDVYDAIISLVSQAVRQSLAVAFHTGFLTEESVRSLLSMRID